MGQVAAQFVAAIAAVELPIGQWMDVIETLLGFMNEQANTPLRVATLQAIGYICESIVSSHPISAIAMILTLFQET